MDDHSDPLDSLRHEHAPLAIHLEDVERPGHAEDQPDSPGQVGAVE